MVLSSAATMMLLFLQTGTGGHCCHHHGHLPPHPTMELLAPGQDWGGTRSKEMDREADECPAQDATPHAPHAGSSLFTDHVTMQ